MKRTLTAISITAFVGMTALAQAQETTSDEQPASGAQLDLGQPVADGPRVGESYTKETFGDWELACIKTDSDSDPCSLVQILKDTNNNPLAEVSLFRLSGSGQAIAGATVMVPLETLLPAQLTVAVDGVGGKRYNYSYCSQIGCIAQIGLTQDDIDAFKKGSLATVTLVPAQAPDQIISLEMSLSGFTAGYNTVDIVEN